MEQQGISNGPCRGHIGCYSNSMLPGTSVQGPLSWIIHARSRYTRWQAIWGYVVRLRLRLGRDLAHPACHTHRARVGHGSVSARPPRAYCLAWAMSRRDQVYIFFPSSRLVSFPIPSSSINLLSCFPSIINDFSGEVLVSSFFFSFHLPHPVNKQTITPEPDSQ